MDKTTDVISVSGMQVKVLESKFKEGNIRICLCHIISGNYMPYVVWHYNCQSDSFYWGKYRHTLEKARECYDSYQ